MKHEKGAGKAIYWIGGSKGGVGKSMMSIAVLDHLVEKGAEPLLVECDNSNPDVWKTYREKVPSELVNLDEIDGWIHLVNTCGGQKTHEVVVNTAARSNIGVRAFGETLDSSLGELGRDVCVLWVINRQRDSLELLKEFIEAVPHGLVHVVRNGYFGKEGQYEFYNESKVREAIESRGGQSLTLPNLADRVANDIYIKRLTLSEAAKTLPIGNRAELARWRREVRTMLEKIVA